jgi:hypothetical protein
MERDPASDNDIGYAVPDKDELFGDAVERIAVRRTMPPFLRVRHRRIGGSAR